MTVTVLDMAFLYATGKAMRRPLDYGGLIKATRRFTKNEPMEVFGVATADAQNTAQASFLNSLCAAYDMDIIRVPYFQAWSLDKKSSSVATTIVAELAKRPGAVVLLGEDLSLAQVLIPRSHHHRVTVVGRNEEILARWSELACREQRQAGGLDVMNIRDWLDG